MQKNTMTIYSRLPRGMVWGIIAVSAAPFILHFFGLDLGIAPHPLSPRTAAAMSKIQLQEAIYDTLAGSFTHLLLEWSAVSIAFATAVLAFIQYQITGNKVTPIIGMALFCAGCIDAFHALTATKLIRSAANNENFIPFTWAFSRMFNVTILLIGGGICLLRFKYLSSLARGLRNRFVLIICSLFLLVSYAIVHISASIIVPRTYFPDHIITRPFDFVPLILYLLLALYIFPQLYTREKNVFSHALMWSMVPAIATQMHMTFGSTTLYDHHFNIAHFLKMCSYAVPFAGIAINYIANHYQEEKKRLAELEKAYVSLEQKNKELEQFAYIASHDLQEPLQTVINFVNLFDEEYQGKLDEKGIKYLNFISQAARRMSALITGLLQYSRIGRRGEPSLVDCNAIVADIQNDLAAVIAQTGAVFQIESLPYVTGYETEIRMLFQNLISNAVKFRKKNTRPEIRIQARRETSFWVFFVQDNGIGIEPRHQKKIFAIFQRLHPKKDYEGTGIGLAHCQKIVNLHGGKIWVKSTPNRGSTFYFTIPVSLR